MSPSKILFILSGSISAYKACEALSRLVQAGHTVRAVATPSALRFVGAATLEGLTGQPVATELWTAGRAMEHVHLTRWADLVLVCPATANQLNRLAAGLADDLPGALFLASERTTPWLLAPAMNPEMWRHPATRAAVERLREWGVRCLPVGHGRTACGETGEGRLAEAGDIVLAVEQMLTRPAGRSLRVVITSGGTAEPIDGVRVLSNTSTGFTGALIARHFARCGHEVLLLRAATAVAVPSVQEEIFQTHADLDRALTEVLGGERVDVVIHAAAVSDFAVAGVEVDGKEVAVGQKLDSRASPVLRLKPQAKIVATLRSRSRNAAVKVVAFKLTDHASEAATERAVAALVAEADADFVVHNDLATRTSGQDAFPAAIHRRGGEPAIACATRGELADRLEELVAQTRVS